MRFSPASPLSGSILVGGGIQVHAVDATNFRTIDGKLVEKSKYNSQPWQEDLAGQMSRVVPPPGIPSASRLQQAEAPSTKTRKEGSKSPKGSLEGVREHKKAND